MYRRLIPAALLLAATPLLAQQAQPAAAAPAKPAQKIVATVNGEVITKEQFDQLWNRLGAQMRAQYEKNGGKAAFLDNYVKKRLLVQEAIKSGFDQRADVRADMEASKESVLFDRYVRDVVAARIVTEKDMRAYYDANQEQFALPESVKVRHIVITAADAGPRQKTKQEALERIQKVATELKSVRFPQGTDPASVRQILLSRFSEAARQHSEDGTAEIGGDLGWNQRGALDPTFEDAAFNLPIGTVSGVIETGFGYHLIYVDERKPAGTEPFESAKASIREYLMTQNAASVMEALNRLTNELRNSSKLAAFPENID
jgi:peptidyl-prolyl cis-trans isomerase C